MAKYKLTIENHPAQARHPITKEPLEDDNGNPVPLFPNQKSVRLDGTIIAYVNEAHKVMFIRHGLGVIADEARALVAKELGDGGSHVVAPPKQPPADDDEFEDDDE